MEQEPRGAIHGTENADHSHDVYTIANIITVLRLILVPFAFSMMVNGDNDILAFVVYVVAGSTDWVDGQIARRTGTVTELGKAIDPLVDRLLIASGVVGLYMVDRLPLWIMVLLLGRDIYLLGGAWILARRRAKRPEVAYVGKVTTALLLAGLSVLILGRPVVPGIGLFDAAAFPGVGSDPACLGIWFVYAGIVTSMVTAMLYSIKSARALDQAR